MVDNNKLVSFMLPFLGPLVLIISICFCCFCFFFFFLLLLYFIYHRSMPFKVKQDFINKWLSIYVCPFVYLSVRLFSAFFFNNISNFNENSHLAAEISHYGGNFHQRKCNIHLNLAVQLESNTPYWKAMWINNEINFEGQHFLLFHLVWPDILIGR